jgi:predicted PurR-regulated permease PerM
MLLGCQLWQSDMKTETIRLVILIIAGLLFVILTFVTDFGLYLLLAFVMCIVSWLLVKTGQRKSYQLLTQLGVAFVIVPMIMILIIFMIKLQLHPETASQLAASTIDAIVKFFVGQLPYILLADFAGVLFGMIIGKSSSK